MSSMEIDEKNSSDNSLPDELCATEDSGTDTSEGSIRNSESSDEDRAPVFPPSASHKKKIEASSKLKKGVKYDDKNLETKSPVKEQCSVENGYNDVFGTTSRSDEEDDEFEMVLVKKPIELSLENLKSLDVFKLSKKEKPFHTADDVFVPTSTICKKMLYIPRPKLYTEEDTKMICPAGIISKTITIRKAQPEDNNTAGFYISSIRRKPSLKLTHLRQRLKPFGAYRNKQKQ